MPMTRWKKTPGRIHADGTIYPNRTSENTADVLNSISSNDLIVKPDTVSKVVDENGEPLVVYHGTPSKFNEFKGDSDETYKDSFWFTTDTEQSSYHARDGYTVKAYLNIKNPQISGDTNILNTSKHDG
jgi:hypothetical protein